ncbi:MAG TPA: VWA domain-containing protein [Pyrinomonadaceae bacterium]|nr:VWA domain-containing protein [Pyrinomonadaceae bacterium]
MKSFAYHFLFIAVAALSAGTWVAGAKAQRPKATPTPTPIAQDSQERPETVFTRRVRLPITVVDKKGFFVSGLTKGDFQVLEDKIPQQIDSFSDDVGQTLPLYVAVLMDTSSSTLGKLKFEQESAINFIQLVVRPRRDRALFATFDDDVNLRQDFTDKIDLLERAVFAVKGLGKQTALYDAVWQFCNEKMRSVQGRRVLVVISDGEDTYSRADLADAIDIAQRTETTIFAISTKAGFSGAVGGVEMGQVNDDKDNKLTKLAEETGGAAFFTGDMIALERSLTKIAKELRTQYLLTYRSTNEQYDGSYRRIDVKLAVSNRGDLKIRTKRGYKAITDAVKP